jgi:hypothetical protein
MIGLQGLPIVRLFDTQRRRLGQQLRHEAAMGRVEVDHDNEDQAASRRHGAEESLERL